MNLWLFFKFFAFICNIYFSTASIDYMEVPEIIWFLFAKKLAGEISASELQELRIFVRDNPAIEPQLEAINLSWKQIPVKNDEKLEAAYLCIKQKISEKDRCYNSAK